MFNFGVNSFISQFTNSEMLGAVRWTQYQLVSKTSYGTTIIIEGRCSIILLFAFDTEHFQNVSFIMFVKILICKVNCNLYFVNYIL